MFPEELVHEVEKLRFDGYQVDMIEAEGTFNLVFHQYPVPNAYTTPFTELLLRLPMAYPNGRPDMFWTEETLGLKQKALPSQANVIETVLGKRWRRFSWHPQAWNPGADNLRTYLEFVNTGLVKAATL